MPRFDFKCLSCDSEFEFLKVRSDDKVECPVCKEKDPKKLEKKPPTSFNFNLKGKGWFNGGMN